METVGLASEGAQLIDSGLSTEVVETILHSRAPSTRKLYALKWKVFTSWCSDHQLDPINCPVGTVLEFLQDRFHCRASPVHLKVYVAAISAYHIPLGGMSLGKTPLVSRFPPWYFEAEVLQAFCPPPFRMRTRKGTSIRCLRLQSCPVPLDQKYGGHQGPDIRSCSPRGFVMRQAGPHCTHSTDLILWTWTLPQVPSALVQVLLV